MAAMAIAAGFTVDQLAKADLVYAPPYSPAMDNIITASDVARNKLDGHMVGHFAKGSARHAEGRSRFCFP